MISILLPTDFSENSMNAITYALEFFKNQETEFYVLHAYQNEFYNHEKLVSREVFNDVLDAVSAQSQKYLDRLLIQIKKIAPNPKFTFHTLSLYDTLVASVNLVAEAKDIDLIVMGTKGKSNERHIVFGSNTFQVLKYVQCPVLAIPSQYTHAKPKRLLFPTNYLIPYKRRELKLLSNLASTYNSVIDVLYVSQSDKLSIRQEDNQAFIKEIISNTDVNFYIEHDKKVVEAIQHYLSNNAIDMLVMVNSHQSFLEDMLFPTHIDRVSIALTIPLLALQNAARTLRIE